MGYVAQYCNSLIVNINRLSEKNGQTSQKQTLEYINITKITKIGCNWLAYMILLLQ